MLQVKTPAPRGEPASGDLLREFQRLKHKPSEGATNQNSLSNSAITIPTTAKYVIFAQLQKQP